MKHFRLLVALDEHGSLHRAAAVMSMTQSAASKALAEIESIVDARLFERSTVGLVSNGAGRAVLRYAQRLCAEVESMSRDVDRIRAGERGKVAVGTVMGALPELVAPAVAQLQAAYPALSIQVVEDTSAQLLEALDDGRLDVVVGRISVSAQPGRYRYRPLLDEPASVVGGPAYRATASRYREWASLARFRWVTYPAYMPMRAMLEHEMRCAGLPLPSGVVATPSAFAALSLLRAGEHLASLLPDSIARPAAERGELTIFPITLVSAAQELGIVVPVDTTPSVFSERLVQLLEARALECRRA